jgi:mRNA interferase HigB
MHVITKRRIKEAEILYPDCESALAGWFRVMHYNIFKSYAELKGAFNAVDKVGNLYVFNIGGNKLRLIASIHFNRQKVYIRHVLTHAAYDKSDWRK